MACLINLIIRADTNHSSLLNLAAVGSGCVTADVCAASGSSWDLSQHEWLLVRWSYALLTSARTCVHECLLGQHVVPQCRLIQETYTLS